MESITEIKLSHSIASKPKNDMNTLQKSHYSKKMKKFGSSKLSTSNTNLTHTLLHNYSTPKLPIPNNIINNNITSNTNTTNTNILLKLTNSSNDIIKEENENERIKANIKRISSDFNKKFEMTKIKFFKNNISLNNKKGLRKSISMIQKEEKIVPKTIFHKIIGNIDKLRIRSDKTLEILRHNLKITKNEIKKRRQQEKQMQLMSNTYMNNFEFRKKKNKNLINLRFNNNTNNDNTSIQNFYITNYKNKSISNILPNISSTNNNDQSISNGSSIINYNNILNDNNYINNASSSFKTGKKSVSQKNKKNKNDINSSEEKTKLINLPDYNLSSISLTKTFKPLYQNDVYKNKKYYKNMYHNRNLDFPLTLIRKQLYKIYGMPAILIEQNSFENDNKMNTLLLNNKIKLIQDNINYFKINIMYKSEFLEAFDNMENYQKGEFNYALEEISCILITIIPMILQNYYEIIKKLISIVIPNIELESQKKLESEPQCLNTNYSFFNSSSDYFNICYEVYRILNLKINRFIYSIAEFGPLNSYLDITRYNTTNIISMAKAFINKTKADKIILEKMEVGLKLKKVEKKEVDILERYHQRHRKEVTDLDIKKDRINRALNMRSKGDNIIKQLVGKKSALNTPVFRGMMKYFKPEIKSKIIALQIMDRYERKKKEKNLDDINDDENNGVSEKKIFV